MATEQNVTFQLGETWSLEFTSDVALTNAELDFDLALGEMLKLSLSDVMSPNPFALADPPETGTVTVLPADQLALEPQTYLYEVRATLTDASVRVVQFGRVVLSASLFAWPEASS